MNRTTHIELTVNGRHRAADVEPSHTLLEVLRDDLGLTGTKECCLVGECGACTVIVDGRSVDSCLMLAVEADGAQVLTVEGLARDGQLSPLQQAFLDKGGVQCGFCIPGQVMSAHALLAHNPTLPEANLQPAFDAFPWGDDDQALRRWQRGLTGYPIVDAGMRELWQTGHMHNRVRMVTGSFLVKNLLLDWRHGRDWFWDCLVDADLAANSASWQWIAGCGADAAPYFRVFNPVLQGRRFDPDGAYVRRWVPELASVPLKWLHAPWEAPGGAAAGTDYPSPVVELGASRARALAAYQDMKRG